MIQNYTKLTDTVLTGNTLSFTEDVKLADMQSVALNSSKPNARNSMLNVFIYKCRVGDGNQGADTADRPLEPHGAPRITLLPQFKLIM